MRGERTRDRDALINRYGLSARLAARVVALLARSTDITESLLEMVASHPALEELLLDGSLLADPAGWGQERLQARGRECGFRDAELLRIVNGPDGWRTIALEDDMLAEEAEAAQGAEPFAGTAVVRATPSAMSRVETERLFTPEEVARLKLAALTSQNPEERIEALRKLVFTPMSGAQKASIFVNVLIDPAADARVRQEAIRSLELIGFRSDLADTVRRLFEAEEEDVLYAVRRIGMLLREAGDAEVGVALAVTLQVLDETDRRPVILELLQLTGQAATVLTQSPQKTEQFIQSALRHLSTDFEALARPVEEAIRAIHRQAPGAVENLLWKEIERSTEPIVRAFLVHLSGSLMQDPQRRKDLAALAVAEILNPQLPESQRARLRYGLVRLGEPAARVVLERLRAETGSNRAEAVQLLDVVCTEGEVSTEVVNESVSMLLELLQVGEQATRRRILEASLPADPRVEGTLRRKVAAELLSHMTEWRLPTTAEMICRTLEKIGVPSLPSLLDYVRRRHPHEDAEDAFQSVAQIAREHGSAVSDEVAAEMLGLCQSLLDDPRARTGGFAIALASVCGYCAPGKERFDSVLGALKAKLWKVRYTFDIFEALGILAGSDNAEPRHQGELFELFDQVLDMKAPEVLGVKRRTADGTVYEFGTEVLFDTRVVPAMVRGLERIGVGSRTLDDLRRDVVRRLLVLWEGVSNVRVVWGPAAVETLVRAICSTARCPQLSTDMRVRLGRSMLSALNKISVVRSMGDICSYPDADRDMQAMCLDAADRMLSEWEGCERQDEERRMALLKGLGQIAANTALDARDARVELMRQNVLAALFQGLREGIHEVQRPLALLRDCPDIPQQQRDEIAERLGRAYGLMRAKGP